MFTANATSPLPFGSIAIYRFMTVIENVILAYIAWSESRHTRKLLSKLTDRQLDDIGLSRGDIR